MSVITSLFSTVSMAILLGLMLGAIIINTFIQLLATYAIFFINQPIVWLGAAVKSLRKARK